MVGDAFIVVAGGRWQGWQVAGGRWQVAGGRVLNFCFESKIKHLANIVFDLVAVSS
jgi:hypothetical protein